MISSTYICNGNTNTNTNNNTYMREILIKIL